MELLTSVPVKPPMRLITHIPLLVACIAGLAATTQPADDPAQRRAEQLRQTLTDVTVEAVVFQLRAPDVDRTLRLDDPAEIAALVGRFTAALTADGLHEGKQRHTTSRAITIRLVLAGAPDVWLSSVGQDMFWAAEGESDESPIDPSLDWVNLQSPALTAAFHEPFEQLAPTTKPTGADKPR